MTAGEALDRVAARPTRSGLDAARVVPSADARAARDPMIGYAWRCVASDAVAFTAAMVTTLMAVVLLPALQGAGRVTLAASVGSLAVLWAGSLALRGAYDPRYLGVGSDEFKRLAVATWWVFALVAIGDYLLDLPLPRGFTLIALAWGLVLLLTGRWLGRVWLGRRRLQGRFLRRTLVIGDDEASAVVEALDGDPLAGFTVVGVESASSLAAATAPGWLESLLRRIHVERVTAVAVASPAALTPQQLRRLAWGLEGPGVDLLVSPALGDVAGPRMQVRPAAGLPLLHLDEPELTGPKRILKRAFDLAVAVPSLLLLSPLLAAIAVVVAVTSRGPVIYRQTRVGRAGRLFTMWKFRTMYDGAHAARDDVIGLPDPEIADRYRVDPRVTPVGRVLRRWSLDEVPQLVNVVTGSMSVVGPRPMLTEELPLLGDADVRRHLSKPGMTGMWQVSGRKHVAWDERMRLDLYYIENWSVALDVIIMARTLKAVLVGHGAY